jgi:hypothetical protein
MLSRRTILRALGFGAPAAVVAAAVGVPAAAGTSPVNVAGLSAIDANMGDVTAGYTLAIRDAVAGDLAKLQAQIDKLQADVPSMAIKAMQDAKRRNYRS